MKYLFLLLLCFSQPALAQRSRTYWEANPDSLLRVAARQTADTARLRTLEHSVRAMGLRRAKVIEVLGSITALAKQLHQPEYAAYRQVLAGQQLNVAASYLQDSLNRNLIRPLLAAQRAAARTERFNRLALDSVKGGLRKFDALGSDQPHVLSTVRLLFRTLHQPEEERAYVEAQLAFYRRRGMVMSIADCCNMLAGSYMTLGDYNRSISYALEAADLYEPLSHNRQQAMLMVAGSGYSSWENDKKAIFYFQRALKGADFILRATIYNELGLIYRDERRYEEALAAANQAQRDATSAVKSKQSIQGGLQQLMSALNQKCLALIALKRLPEVDQLLPKVQALGDSIMRARDTGNTVYNNYETWAKYYAAHGQWQQATAARQASYKEALEDNSLPEQLFCLRALAEVYDAQGKATQTAFYAMAALKIDRELRVKQNGFNVAYYEQQTVERRQAARIAGLRQTQARAEAQAHQQRTALWWLLGGLSALVGLALWQGRSHRRQQRANTLLAAQKAQIEEQATRLGELDEAKNQFFANVSHELRTPLTLVLGPLDTLLTDPTQALPAAAQAPVALAYRQAQRLLELVNRILDLTKLQAGRLALHPKPTPLAALLRRVVTQFESLATQRGISLLGPAALPDGLRVLLDADKVEEVLTNLLINALNHTPTGGTVQVTAALPGPDGYYHVTVQDTGPGIAPAEQARVFERFYQSPQAQAQGGTGLGLALSRELAALLGGTLTLVSEPGQGAAFTLRFPALVLPTEAGGPPTAGAPTEAAPASVSSRLSPGSAGPRPRVLVVEDQPDLREYLRSLLAPTCEVLTAADGQAALDLLAHADPVDLITTDVMMPRLNGTELLARLRADPAQQQVPVLMLTARADDAHRLAALTLGVDDYLTKPFARTELLARVQALLARHQVRRHFAALPPEPEEAAPAPVAAAPEPTVRTSKLPPPLAASQLAEWQARVSERLGDEQFGPAELAELLCLSERTLYRRLGELAGLTPAAWLRELRLDWARRLLEAGTHRSVAEVADTVGFASPKYFATLYAERFGRRPADYHS